MNIFVKLIAPLVILASVVAVSAASLIPKTVHLTNKNTVQIRTQVDDESVADTILSLEANTSPVIFLYIESPGGSVIDGIALVNYLRNTKKNIHCVANFAASMAHAILEACPVRLATETNILMQHKIRSGAQGTPGEIEGELKIMKGLENFLDTMESKRIGISKEEFERRTAIPWFTVGEESKKENVVDEIVDVECSPELYTISYVKKVSFGQFAVDVKFNGCPLIPLVVAKR